MHKNITKYTLVLLSIVALFTSCEKEYENIKDIDEAKIQAYIQKNNITAIKDPSGYYYQILEKGTGEPLLNKDSVLYSYAFNALTGKQYYSTPTTSNEGTYVGYTDRFSVSSTQGVSIPAFREVMVMLNRGGKARIILPSYLAFGKNGVESIGVSSNEILLIDLSTYTQKSQLELEDKRITDFIKAKGLTGFVKEPSGVYKSTSVVGTGAAITLSSTVTVKYTGRLLTGTVFDQSTTDLVTSLSGVVVGWEKALVGVTKGSKIRIFIPSDLGYGPAAYGSIPGKSILDFDIEVVEVVN